MIGNALPNLIDHRSPLLNVLRLMRLDDRQSCEYLIFPLSTTVCKYLFMVQMPAA
jgi:hypothetical protein